MSFKMDFTLDLKTILIIIAIIVLGIIGYKKLSSVQSRIEDQKIEFEQLKGGLARAENELLATKAELMNFAKQLDLAMGDINKDLKKLDAKLVAIGETVVEIKGKVANNVPADTQDENPPIQPEECKLCDIWGWTGKVARLELPLGSMPYAKVEFRAANKEPFSYILDGIEIKIDTVLGENKDGMFVFYHKVNMFNLSRPELKDKPFPLTIVSSTYKQIDPTEVKSFYWWAPKLDIGAKIPIVFSDPLDVRPGAALGLSIMGYGISKTDLSWRFASIGGGVNSASKPFIFLSPMLWNIGKTATKGFLNNVWLSVDVTYDGAFGAGIGLSATL